MAVGRKPSTKASLQGCLPHGSPQCEQSKKESKGVLKTEAAVFYNLILTVTYHNFCNMLLVTETNSNSVWEGTIYKGKNTRKWDHGGHLGGWLPQSVSYYKNMYSESAARAFISPLYYCHLFSFSSLVFSPQTSTRMNLGLFRSSVLSHDCNLCFI